MKYRDNTVKSIRDLIKVLGKQTESLPSVWFRGQADAEWNLTPSLARRGGLPEAESMLAKRFKQNALPHLTHRPESEWEWLFLMQHYRLPTRLLDWTESPLVGLYFAVADGSARDKPAALWCLDPITLNASANIKFGHAVEIPGFDHDEVLDNYLPSKIAKEHTSVLNPIAGIAVRNSPRIAAQMGAFTVTHRNHTSIESVGNQAHIWRLIIPSDAKRSILSELATLRVTPLALFPELDRVAEAAMEVVS